MSDLKLGLSDLNSVIRRIIGEEWDDITPEEVEQKKQDIRAQAPYPWCHGNPTIKECIEAGYCQRDPSCGD